jgi:hypothetical protein
MHIHASPTAEHVQAFNGWYNMPCDPEISLNIIPKIACGPRGGIMRAWPAAADQQMPMRALLQ